MFNHVCQYYSGNIYDATPKGTITLKKMLMSIKNPKPNMVDLIDRIRHETDKGKRSLLKTKLVAFTPCAYVRNGSRKYDNITGFTQVMTFDFDGLPSEEYSDEFKNELFKKYPFIYACWKSASGKGVRGLVRIPKVKSTDEFKNRFNALEEVLGIYKGWDSAPKNCILPLFYSIDTNLLIREFPDKFFDIINPNEVAKMRKNFADTFATISDDKKYNRVVKITTSGINKITDNGHPQLRGVAVALGGYVGGGYLSEIDAINLIDALIESNNYLSIKPNVYKRTARQMIKYGINKPLEL